MVVFPLCLKALAFMILPVSAFVTQAPKFGTKKWLEHHQLRVAWALCISCDCNINPGLLGPVPCNLVGPFLVQKDSALESKRLDYQQNCPP